MLGCYKHLLKILRCAFSFLFYFCQCPSNLWDNTHLEISRCACSLLYYPPWCPSNPWDDAHLKISRCTSSSLFYFHWCPSNLWDSAHLEILRCACSFFIILLSLVQMEMGKWAERHMRYRNQSPPTSPFPFTPEKVK
jgi:hypothetical protein